jgi:hypothetical protein
MGFDFQGLYLIEVCRGQRARRSERPGLVRVPHCDGLSAGLTRPRPNGDVSLTTSNALSASVCPIPAQPDVHLTEDGELK